MNNDSPVVDGITPASAPSEISKPEAVKTVPDDRNKVVGRMKFVLLLFIALPYGAYIVWSLFLLSILPDPSGQWEFLIPMGRLVAMIVGGGFLFVAVFGVLRVGKNANLSDRVRYLSFFRLGIALFPALALSGLVPMMITKEPILSMYISSPEPGTELIAPVSVTFSADAAVEILSRRGIRPIKFEWDFNADAIIDQETVVPSATALFERQGTNIVSANIQLNDGTTRTLSLRVAVPNAVFSYTPVQPVVDEPVRFSVSHLIPVLPDGVLVRDVQWDFNGDDIPDQTGINLQATHTFLRTGPQNVSATISFSNQTQANYIRTLVIREPDPLPFPVRILTTPEFLESPSPFQVVFRVETEEPIQDVVWDFGDGTKDVGLRVGHTFRDRSTYQVLAEVRNKDGKIAKLTKTLKVVNSLRLLDLAFSGSHQVVGDKISATSPVAIELSPKTSTPLVNFFWEASGASEVESTDTTLKATYRIPGVYNIVLIGQDAEGSVLRKSIVLEVKPQEGKVNFDMKPTQGTAPLPVQFDATDTFIPGDEITGFVWTFGDGDENSQVLESARIEHIFAQPGTYTVMLTVYTISGVSKTATRTIVVRAPTLDACFNVSRMSGPAPLGVHFDRSCTTGLPKKVLWDFGDGSQSNEDGKTVDHVFQDPGATFNVRLRLEDESGIVSTYTQEIRTD